MQDYISSKEFFARSSNFSNLLHKAYNEDLLSEDIRRVHLYDLTDRLMNKYFKVSKIGGNHAEMIRPIYDSNLGCYIDLG